MILSLTFWGRNSIFSGVLGVGLYSHSTGMVDVFHQLYHIGKHFLFLIRTNYPQNSERKRAVYPAHATLCRSFSLVVVHTGVCFSPSFVVQLSCENDTLPFYASTVPPYFLAIHWILTSYLMLHPV